MSEQFEETGMKTDLLEYILDRRIYSTYQHIIASLTCQQTTVLRLMGAGMNTKEIAFVMSLSSKTVEYHRMKLYQATKTSNPAQVTIFAIMSGLVPLIPAHEKQITPEEARNAILRTPELTPEQEVEVETWNSVPQLQEV